MVPLSTCVLQVALGRLLEDRPHVLQEEETEAQEGQRLARATELRPRLYS